MIVRGPVGNFEKHLLRRHPEVHAIARAAYEKGNDPVATAQKLIAKSMSDLETAGIMRYLRRTEERPGRATSEINLLLWLVEKNLPFSCIDVNCLHFLCLCARAYAHVCCMCKIINLF